MNVIRYIYTFFVGLFLAIFIGTGIAVFYAAPQEPEPPLGFGIEKSNLTEPEKQQIETYNVQQRDFMRDEQIYNRNVSIIVLICSVIILIIALVFSDRLGIVADGLLLGGIFTLLYGIARGMASDSNQYRFVVAAVGLAVTIILGYVKFAKSVVRKG